MIATAGTLVALILGFVSLAGGQQPGVLSPAAVLLLALALAALVCASAAALLINLPVRTPVVDAAQLTAQAGQAGWNRADEESLREEYQMQGQILIALRKVNRWRARVLFLALLFEVVALVLMAVGTGLVLQPLL